MDRYEYKIVPAPTKGVKARGVKTADARFAHALELSLNALAEDGWEYQRAETLPCEERQGLTGSTTTYRNMLIFRRVISEEQLPHTPDDQVAETPQPVGAAPPVIPNEKPTLESIDADTPVPEGSDAAQGLSPTSGEAPDTPPEDVKKTMERT